MTLHLHHLDNFSHDLPGRNNKALTILQPVCRLVDRIGITTYQTALPGEARRFRRLEKRPQLPEET